MTWNWRPLVISADGGVTLPRSGEPPERYAATAASVPRATARVLVVDGDRHARAHLRDLLRGDGYDVLEAPDGPEAVDLFASEAVDLVLLELALPGMSGFTLCRAIRDRSDAAIVVVTALREEVDTVLALEIGADDYVTKPFLDRELSLRVKAVLRRAARHVQRTTGAAPCAGRIRLDPQQQAATVDEQRISLSLAEFRLLETLVSGRGHVLTRRQIATAVWGEGRDADGKALDAQVRRLRSKIEDDPRHPRLLLTVRGVGYRLAV
jgi:two-component system response regulator RegX3